MCCRMGKLIMVGILTNGSLNVTWYRPKLHSFALSFCVFNLYILSLTMQGTCAIEGNTSLCVEDNECRTSGVMLCVLKKEKKKSAEMAERTQWKAWWRRRHAANAPAKSRGDPTLGSNVLLSTYISFYCCIYHPHRWDIWKESMIYTKTLIIIHCMLINSEFLHLPCGRPRVLEMQPFQSS